MNFFNEYGLLVAAALPVVAIVGLQVFLFIAGERGTGLIPGVTRYPSIEFNPAVAEVATQPVASEPSTITITIASSNDEEERLAA
jgi:hypothetical protein